MPPPGEPRNIRLQGPGWEPPGYDAAPLEARRWYWKTLGDIAHEVKREEISRGIGISGRPLKPIIQKYRKDGATGPPLIPHDFESRTQRLLAIHVMVDGVTLFWRGHGRQSWATILGYHAYKHGPRALPVRNTIGISRGGMTRIRARAFAAWRARAKVEPPAPPPAPPPEPPPKPPRVPKPRPVPKPKPPAPPKPPPKPKEEYYYGYKVHTELPKRRKGPIIFSGGKAKPPPAPPPKPPAKPKPPTKPPAVTPPPPSRAHKPKPAPGPVLPGRPIAERIAGNVGVEAKRQAVIASDTVAVLAVPPDQQANWKEWGLSTLEPLTRERAQAGTKWLESKLNAPGVTISHQWYEFRPNEDRRAWHVGRVNPVGKVSEVHIGREQVPAIHVHELGHAIEWQVPGVHDAVEEFLAHRVGDEAPRSMDDVAPGVGYERTEMGRKDKFDAHFSERDAYYVGLVKTNGNSEVLSMGLQAMYNDAVAFAKNDPEFFNFIIGILDGSLL